MHVFPREILASRTLLAEVESKLAGLAARPALLVWGTKDFAFGDAERRRWEQVFPEHHTDTCPDRAVPRRPDTSQQQDFPTEVPRGRRAQRGGQLPGQRDS